MALLPTLRRVLANLQDGRPADAVRTDEPAQASAAFRHRLQAQAATDAWLQTLLPALPTRLHATLQQCTAVRDDTPPVTSLPALLTELSQRQDGLRAALHRGGMPTTVDDQALLGDLAELLDCLPRLMEPGAASGIPPAS